MLLLSGILSLLACESFLDKQPDDMLTMDQVFKSEVEARSYLANVYSYVLDEADPYTNFSPVSDESDFVWTGVAANNINNGSWNPTNVPYNHWARFYRGIRSASVLMDRIGECAECDEKNPGITTRYRAEARVLRAFYYFNLMRQFGPVPIVEAPIPVDAQVSDTQVPRASYDENVSYLVSEIEEALKDLPPRTPVSSDYGRVDQRFALALKSRILLYAASPLWNGNQDYAGFKNPDGKQLVNTTYDVNKWKLAADAAKAVIDMMPEGLYTNTSGAFDPYLSYQNLFIDRWNKEVIWARSAGSGNSWQQHATPRQARGWNGLSPTQQMVDAYHMANGKRIDEPGSGYVEEGFATAATRFTTAGTWNMYVGREPRFYVSILYNGADWKYRGANGNTPTKIQLYFTGASGKSGSHDHTETGYLLTKFFSPNTDVANGRYDPLAWILFRLGEMYLNYAEALNEHQPGHADIAKYVNLIRERAGLPALPSGLSQNEMRERIRHERRLELAFEGHRPFDNRRWKIAIQTDGGPMGGMNVNAGTSFTDVSFFRRSVFETRVFDNRHYLWPIPQSEIDRNKKMAQNPGW
ncbi:MAG: RagB/SusD family nutrient uptake outer membrane protein [Adhaeribacter sp.]